MKVKSLRQIFDLMISLSQSHGDKNEIAWLRQMISDSLLSLLTFGFYQPKK